MTNANNTFGTPSGSGISRMSFEDAVSVASLNRGLSISSSDMTFGDAFKCRWSKIRSGLAI